MTSSYRSPVSGSTASGRGVRKKTKLRRRPGRRRGRVLVAGGPRHRRRERVHVVDGRAAGHGPRLDGRGRVADAGSMRILACGSGSPRASKASETPSSPTVPGDQRGGVDLPIGQRVQGVAELQRRVAEHEAQVELLVDRHRGPEAVAAHADADHHHPGGAAAPGETTDSIIPGTPTHSNTTGPDGVAAPSRVGGAEDVVPAGHPAEPVHRADREPEQRRAPRCTCFADGDGVRRLLGRVDDDVRAAAPSRGRAGPPTGRRRRSCGRPRAFSHADHREADRAAAEHDRDVPLADRRRG